MTQEERQNLVKQLRKLGKLFTFLYPPSLLFILGLPILVSIIPAFNPNATSALLVDRLKVLVFWLPLFASLYLFINRRIVLFILSIPFMIVGTVEILHLFLINSTLSEATLFAIFDTDPGEAVDYVSMSVAAEHYLIAAVYILASLTLVFLDKTASQTTKGMRFVAIGALAGILIVVTYKEGQIAFHPVVEAAILFSKEIEEHEKRAEKRKQFLNNLEPLKGTISLSDAEQTYVLIIGESTNRNHTSLYGYQRDTTPLLDSRKNSLLVYQDVVSPFTLTSYTLRMALTRSNKENGQKYYEAFSIIDVARAAGFETYWISNQSPSGKTAMIGRTSDKSFFVNLSGWRHEILVSHDGKVLAPFEKVLGMPAKKKLIMVHLMGNHFAYDKRYPDRFKKFVAHEDEKQRLIDEYDNAVLYADYIVSEMLAMLEGHNNQSPGRIAGLLFFSDHGEEVFDLRDYAGHAQWDLSRHQVEIPFLVWVSESFKREHAAKYEQMRGNLDQPYMTDDLFHSMLDLMNISSTQLDPTRSLFSKTYQPRKRVINRKDYDRDLRTEGWGAVASVDLNHSRY